MIEYGRNAVKAIPGGENPREASTMNSGLERRPQLLRPVRTIKRPPWGGRNGSPNAEEPANLRSESRQRSLRHKEVVKVVKGSM